MIRPGREPAGLSSPADSPHIRGDGEAPAKKKPKKDPARATRAKAARPDAVATPDKLADLLNPAIGQGTAGLGSGTGLTPPPETSWERRQDFSAAHTARKSTKGFEEAPQSEYTGSPITGLDPALAKELGLGDQEPPFPPPEGEGRRANIRRAQPSEAGLCPTAMTPSPDALRASTSPLPGGET